MKSKLFIPSLIVGIATAISMISTVCNANAQSNRPYVILVNGNADCCTWSLLDGGNVPQNRVPNMQKLLNIPNADFRMTAWDHFQSGGRQRQNIDAGVLGSYSTSNDRDFINQASDFINNQLDPSRPLIIIAHSYGGDSVLKLAHRITRRIQFLGVIDPVGAGGFRTPIRNHGVPSNVDYFFNRWQENAFATDNIVPFDSRGSGSINGCNARTCDQLEQSLARNVDGSEIRVSCESWEVTCAGYNPIPVSLGGSNGTKATRLTHNPMPSDKYIEQQILDLFDLVFASYTPPVANVLISSTDSIRGWSWDGTTASYVAIQNGENVLYVSPFDGKTFGSVISRQVVSSSNAFRGWSWNGTTASYVTFKSGGKSILYVRPFDGRSFGPVTEQQVFSDTDSIRGWSWDGSTASYVTVQNGRNVLYVRPFNGRSFGAETPGQTISSTDSIRGWSWDGTTASYVAVNENGGSTVYMRPFNGRTFGF